MAKDCPEEQWCVASQLFFHFATFNHFQMTTYFVLSVASELCGVRVGFPSACPCHFGYGCSEGQARLRLQAKPGRGVPDVSARDLLCAGSDLQAKTGSSVVHLFNLRKHSKEHSFLSDQKHKILCFKEILPPLPEIYLSILDIEVKKTLNIKDKGYKSEEFQIRGKCCKDR